MSDACPWCDGSCAGATLGPLLDPRLSWIWTQLASLADRKGDPHLTTGFTFFSAPPGAEERAAAGGLLGGPLRASQRRRIDLSELTQRIRTRGERLTPGAVAAHSQKRRLAERAREAAARSQEEDELHRAFLGALAKTLSPPEIERSWTSIRRSGLLARLRAHAASPNDVVEGAAAVIAALPLAGQRLDRRRLAVEAVGDPHALDQGSLVATLSLAILTACGRVPPRVRPRAAWAMIGVEWDDVTNGLITLGLAPEGWHVEESALITLSPRVLATCTWPKPEGDDEWIFVTENPSVIGAAAERAGKRRVRVLCTSGTPALREVIAIGRLAARGWKIAARADFDEAGIAHVTALLRGVPTAVPWRMNADDYLSSLARTGLVGELPRERLLHTPWDQALAVAMNERGTEAFEETLLDELLEDIERGRPREQDAEFSFQPPFTAPSTRNDDAPTTASVEIRATRNCASDDTLVDWLELHADKHGFKPDDTPRDLDFRWFMQQQTIKFRAAVYRLLEQRAPVVHIPLTSDRRDAQTLTHAALLRGVPLVARAALHDPLLHTHGVADLLIRSDLLGAWLWDPLESTCRHASLSIL